MARVADWLYPQAPQDDFLSRLEQFLAGASGLYGQVEQDELRRRQQEALEQDRMLARVLGLSQLQEKQREFDVKQQQERRRRTASRQLYGTPTVQQFRTTVEEPGQPLPPFGGEPPQEFEGTETPTTLPILRDLMRTRRTPLHEALSSVEDKEALTGDDLARAAKVYPETPALDPLKFSQTVEHLGKSPVRNRSELAQFLFGADVPGVEFEPPKLTGRERKAQIEADVLEGLPSEDRRVAVYPSLKPSREYEPRSFEALLVEEAKAAHPGNVAAQRRFVEQAREKAERDPKTLADLVLREARRQFPNDMQAQIDYAKSQLPAGILEQLFGASGGGPKADPLGIRR